MDKIAIDMAEMIMCRICLRRNVKLFHHNWYQLKRFYDDLFDLEIVDENKLPKYFCFECAAMLHKFHKFKEKCSRGQKILLDIIKNEQMTNTLVKELEGKELQSYLDIITVNERVKTIHIKSRAKLFYTEQSADKLKTEQKSEPETVLVDEDIQDECKNIQNVLLFFNDGKITDDSIEINVNEKIDNEVTDKINDVNINEMTVDSINDEIIEDSEMIVNGDDDRDFSSEDDNLLIELVKVKKLNGETKDTVLTVDKKVNDTKKRKKNRGNSTLKRISEEKPPKITLDSKHWERRYLNEEEAEQQFKKRAQDPKYMAAAYQCVNCFKGFSQEDMLIRHNKKKHAESLGRNVCSFCQSRFKWKCHLTRHLHQHYNVYTCLRCHLVCNLESTALLHEEHHNGIVKTCEHCGEQYTHTSTYYSHLRSHRSSFLCTLCGQSFVSETGLRFHKILKHINMDPPQKQSSKSGEEEGSDETYCAQCDIRFETREAYDQHYLHSAMHSHGSIALGGEDKPSAALIKARTRTIHRSPRKPRTCPTCEATFRTQTAFFQHRCLEHKPLALGGGGGGGQGVRALKGPTGRSYRNAEKNICEICGASVAAVYMEQHINTHTHQKAYPCTTCGVKLYAQSSLKRHQLTHTGERPYPCPLCDKRFTQSNSMKLHYRTFHLKEPYPKRNRRKKDETAILEFSLMDN